MRPPLWEFGPPTVHFVGVLQNHAQKSLHARWDVKMEGGGGMWMCGSERVWDAVHVIGVSEVKVGAMGLSKYAMHVL